MEMTEEIHFFTEEVKKEITITRFEHSIRVAEIAFHLSKINGITNPHLAYLAGILHDITKQKPNSFHEDIFQRHSFDYSHLPQPAFHPHSAYFYIQDKYKFDSKEVLSAIKNHTLGGVDLPKLDYILYVSDFLGSEFALRSPSYDTWMKQTEESLHFGILLKSKSTIEDLLEKNLKIHENTFRMYNETIRLVSSST